MMKLSSTLPADRFPLHMLRRMVSWVCAQIELPVSKLTRARFGKRSTGEFRGTGGYRFGILVRLNLDAAYPIKAFLYPGRTSEAFLSPDYNDIIETLIGVTAHELTHVREHLHILQKPAIRALRRGWNSERQTRYEERRVLEIFRSLRETLMADWMKEPPQKAAKPKATIQEKRAAKAAKKLAEWQRKAKLAATKVKQYKRQVGYYERTLAANRGK